MLYESLDRTDKARKQATYYLIRTFNARCTKWSPSALEVFYTLINNDNKFIYHFASHYRKYRVRISVYAPTQIENRLDKEGKFLCIPHYLIITSLNINKLRSSRLSISISWT